MKQTEAIEANQTTFVYLLTTSAVDIRNRKTEHALAKRLVIVASNSSVPCNKCSGIIFPSLIYPLTKQSLNPLWL